MADQQISVAAALDQAVQQTQQGAQQTSGASVGSPAAVGQANELTAGMLRIGSNGAAVQHAQTLLNQHGASLTVDGIFGPLTHRATVQFQSAQGLMADGIIGPQTWEALGTDAPTQDKPPETRPEPPDAPPDDGPPGTPPPPDGGGGGVSPLQSQAAAKLPDLLANPAMLTSPFAPVVHRLNGTAGEADVADDARARAAAPQVDAARLAMAQAEIAAAMHRILIVKEPYPGPKGAPTEIDESRQRIMAAHAARSPSDPNWLTEAERSWLADFQQALGIFLLMQGWFQADSPDEPLDPGRAAIVTAALGEVGKVEARRHDGGPAKPVPGSSKSVEWRKGAADLDRIFTKAGAVTEDGHSGAGTASRDHIYDWRVPLGRHQLVPSWCGIFALAMHKYAGRTSANWAGHKPPWVGRGAGPNAYDALGPREFPKPGDIAYQAGDQHHGTVISVTPNDPDKPHKGFKVVTVDGNFAKASAIVLHEETHPNFWLGFFRAAPKGR